MGSGYNNFKCDKNGDIFFLAGDSLIIYDFESIVEYDTATGNEKGNLEALEKATIAENTNYYPTFLNAGSKNKIYYYTTLGLYEYDIQSEKVKQLVDSAISSFGYADTHLTSFIEKSNGEFLATFSDFSSGESGSSIINFAYDENIPSVPENQLVVYSLLENYAIRQAISGYTKEHPDTYVKYEIGLNYDDGVTQSDALKTLNTKIMAGNGSDVIILYGLSAESYTNYGKVYQIPTSFKYPILLGNKDYIKLVSDLDSLVELTKKLSTETEI